MISILKQIERLASEDKCRKAYRRMVESILHTTREHILVTDTEEHTWFCASLENFMERLREDSSPTNVEVVGALVTKTLADHYSKVSRQAETREQELKRIINLLTECAGRLDNQNRQFYVQLRQSVQNFQSISQLEDIAFLRKKLSEQVSHLQDAVGRQEASAGGLVARLQAELDAARNEIEALSQAASTDPLTQLPARRAAEKLIRELVEQDEPFSIGIAVIERLDLINLRYGSLVGDSVLRRFSRVLRSQLPKRALLCRWGGPAFVAVLERTPAADLKASLQKILATIAAQPVEAEGKASGMFHITSRYAVHQWLTGQTADKIIGLINVFCLAQKIEGPESAGSGAGSIF
jgi:diguanylate cyclase (GGDEF)-like protein